MVSDVCNIFSSFLAKEKKRESLTESCVTKDLCGEAGEIYNVFIFSGKKKTNKQKKKKR